MGCPAEVFLVCLQLADQITVIQGVIETVQLPEKVDIIISEVRLFMLGQK